MDSTEEFRFEVPIIPLHTLKSEMTDVTDFDNDCSIVEFIESQENLSIQHNRDSSCKQNHIATYVGQELEVIGPTSMSLEELPSEDCTIIESSNLPNGHNLDSYDDIYKENKLFAELIEKCLNMEDSLGMLRIIKKTLVPIYKDTDCVYRQSAEFNKILLQYLIKLDTHPDRKFSHIKSICEVLKSNVNNTKLPKKRVSLVTLQTNLNGKYPRKKSKRCNKTKRAKSKNTCPINDNVLINCDSDTDCEISTNNVDNVVQICDSDSDSVGIGGDEDVIPIDDENDISNKENNSTNAHVNNTDHKESVYTDKEYKNVTNNNSDSMKIDDDIIPIDDEMDNSNKENNSVNAHINNTGHKEPLVTTDKGNENLNNNNKVVEIDISNDDDEIVNSNKIFSPGEITEPEFHKAIQINMDPEAAIKNLERQIEIYTKKIAKLEEEEVCHDGVSSPYVQCEIFKEKVVNLYKEICELKGAEAVKRHEVRLKVAAGHEEGPVRCLEEFVNSNIDEHGNPPFPDMLDVVQCVCKANVQYNLNWNKAQIMAEAKALFIYYGRAIQKRRQKREWRDLLKYVKEEVPDPADVDPLLEAKLAENDRISRRKEQELLERYCAMENSYADMDLNAPIENDVDSNDDSDENDSPVPNVFNSDKALVNARCDSEVNVHLNSYEKSCTGNLSNNVSLSVSNPVNSVSNSGVASDIVILQNDNINNLRTMDIMSLPQLALPNCMGTLTVTGKQNFECISDGPRVQMFMIAPMNSVNNFGAASNYSSNFITYGSDMTRKTAVQNEDNIKNSPHNVHSLRGSNVVTLRNDINLSGGMQITDNIINNQPSIESSTREKADLEDYPKISKTTVVIDPENENESQSDVVLKREPEDIPRLLEELGEEFTTTIFDIVDPFEVIEVSDSSDSEEE